MFSKIREWQVSGFSQKIQFYALAAAAIYFAGRITSKNTVPFAI
jgi:hypothetical protein